MKRLITATVILLSLGSSAFAMGASKGLSSADAQVARTYVRNADLSNLTSAQVQAIESALHSDNENVGAQIRSILMWN